MVPPPSAASRVYFSLNSHHGFPLSADLFPSLLYNPVRDPQDFFNIYPEESGWILGPNKELFLWIPPDVRSSLWLPGTADDESENKFHLDLSRYSCGPRWTECRRTSTSNPDYVDIPDDANTEGEHNWH
jgi:hypothetical protein